MNRTNETEMPAPVLRPDKVRLMFYRVLAESGKLERPIEGPSAGEFVELFAEGSDGF